MVIMETGELLTEVSIFLRVTLAQEKLSKQAQDCRQQLISRLCKREGSPPQAYIDMNGSSTCPQKLEHQISDCYEEFDNSFDTQKSAPNITDGYVNNLYNNLSLLHEKNVYANNDPEIENFINIKHPSPYEDNTYINPSSPLANTPVISKPSLPAKNPQCNSNSQRNSVISFKKDSPDRSSDSSSCTSSSTRCGESPEVLAMSASALRYAATKSGALGRREKFLFLDHTKFYWAAVHNQTLFMFATDKDCKPMVELDITGYKARPVAIPANNKTDFKFELVSPGKKTHHFVAEKQSDMERWIAALNAATKVVDPPKEWIRQLPTLPQAQDTYDQLDSARPVVEAEYELPDTLLRTSPAHYVNNQIKFTSADNNSSKDSKRNSSQSLTGKETRRLPLLPHQQETYDQPEPTIRPVVMSEPQPELYESFPEELYHCIDDKDTSKVVKSKEALRRLPSLPHEQETYDQPEPTVRPVIQPKVIVQEEFYSVIDSKPEVEPVSQEAFYKNVDNDARNQNDESSYYNLVPYPERETDQECIYDVITEHLHLRNPSPTCLTKRAPTNVKLLESKPVNREVKLKLEEKRLSPLVSNMATIFNKPFTKPQLRQVKPPVVT